MTAPIAPDLASPQALPAKAPAGVLRRLLKRRLALTGLVIIAITVAGALLAPWLAAFVRPPR